MDVEHDAAGTPNPGPEQFQPEPASAEPTTSEIAMRDRDMALDVDSLLSGEFEPLEFARELDTQFELILDMNRALETDLKAAKDELRDIKRRNTQLEKLVRQATAEIKRGQGLDEKPAAARRDYEALLEQVDAVKQEIEREELVIKKRDEKIARLSEARDRVKYEIEVLRNRIESVRAEKVEIGNRLQAVDFDLRDFDEQKKGVEEAIRNIRRKTKATRDNITKIKRTLSNVITAFANTRNKARLQFGHLKTIEE